MKISRNSECLPIILAMALVFWAGSATAQEQRCNQLGAACRCSEPLNTNAFVWDNVPGNDEPVNPTDSNSKECHGGNAIQVGEQRGTSAEITYLVPTAETGMPSGNSVNYVWRWNQGQGYIIGFGNTPLQSSTKRICYRHYIRMSSNYDGGTSINCDAGKFTQFKWSQTYDLQMGSGGCAGRNCELKWGAPGWNRPGFNFDQTPAASFKYSDCYGQWCRIETCLSGDFAGGTGDFFVEGYVTRLSDGKRADWLRRDIGPGNPGLNMSVAPWIVNGFRGDGNDPLTCTGGHPQDATNAGAYREVSHLMQAEWTTDVPGTFIGPAYEVEGAGSAGSAPPPPPPSSDPSPIPGPSQTGALVLLTDSVVSGGGATVTSTVAGGVGPYQFLFDCGRVGVWQGIINTSSTSAQYTCSLGGQSSIQVRALAWDRTTNAAREQIVQISAGGTNSTVGKPGTPGLVAQ